MRPVGRRGDAGHHGDGVIHVLGGDVNDGLVAIDLDDVDDVAAIDIDLAVDIDIDIDNDERVDHRWR